MNSPAEAILNHVLFHPRRERPRLRTSGFITATRSLGETIGGILYPGPDTGPLVLFFHGNGEIASDYESLADFYAGCGAWLWATDYRGYGRSTGEPSYAALFADAEALLADVPAVEELAGRRFPAVVVMGRSLGSAPALHLASRHAASLGGLVLDSAFSRGPSLFRRLGAPAIDPSVVPGYRDNLAMMREAPLPCLLLHGVEDDLIPVRDAHELFAVCPNPDKRLVEIPGAGHNDLLGVNPRLYREELAMFLRRVGGA